ncbi:MAG: Asp23/Gls24 family envelope stress response protein [Actinomycetota bacterium]|nr:Asp23/Gls24 family envelope stress response protein [Actinomycetota bacterium]
MSESGQQSSESPLLSDRGATIISDTVVTSIAGMAAQEVDGVHMGGGASRTASGVLGSLTGSESKTSGISVEVGRTEAAIDLKMGIEYDKNILQTVEEVRRRITDRIQNLTGLRIKELNATITDITFPEKEERRRIGSGSATRESDAAADETATVPAQPRMPESEPGPGTGERDTTQVETSSQTETETPPEEEASVERRPTEGDETAEPRSGDTRTEEQSTGEASETSEEPETRAETEASQPTETDAEERRRRRAEERARRRRRTEDN